MGRKISFLFSVLMLLVLTACGGSSGSKASSGDESYQLSVTTVVTTTHPFSEETLEPFMERVEELTDGQVEFDYYPAEQLGKGEDFVHMVGDGVVDIAHFNAWTYPNEFPISSSLMAIPGLVTTGEEMTPIFNELIKSEPILDEDFLKNNVRPIMGMVTLPYALFTTGKEVRVPKDLKGMKVMSNGGVFRETIEQLGATPVTLSPSEMYEAFEKGVVDVVNHYPSTLNAWSMGDLINNGAPDSRFGAGPYGLMINEDTWQSLPEDIQEAISQAGEEIAKSSSVVFDEDSLEVEEEWIDEGLFDSLTEEEEQQWLDAYEDIRDEWLEKQDNPKYEEAYELMMEKIEELD